MIDKKIIITALLFGVFSIVLGAFGAHAFKKVLSAEQLSSFETGVKYLMYQAFFLLFIGSTQFLVIEQKNYIYYMTLVGSLFFSGSIFLLVTRGITGINFKFLGPITPIGGLLLIISWTLTLVYISIKKI